MLFSTAQLLYTITPFLIANAYAAEPIAEEKPYFTFVTRPDIQAPKWNFTVYKPNLVAPGYWFTAPYVNIGPQLQPGEKFLGPYIYDGSGELIWSGAKFFNYFATQDFRVAKVKGKDMLQAILFDEGFSYALGNDYKVAYKVPLGPRDVHSNMHELNFIDNGERVIILEKDFANATLEMSAEVDADGECNVKWDKIKEMEVGTWETVFDWTSYGRIGLNDSTFQHIAHKCAHEWDYLHSNAVDKCPDGDYVLSARHADTIYKISHIDGSIVWKLHGKGVKTNDFELDGFKFSRQHGVRCQSQNETHTVIRFLDNAKAEDNMPTFNYSRGLQVALSTETQPMTAHIEMAIDHPDRDYSFRRGSYQIMEPSGHSLVCWSERGHFSEHAPDGTMLLDARYAPRGLGTYRSYKDNWVGLPSDPPDVVAQGTNDHDDMLDVTSTSTVIYMSWNGATEVASWRVYKTTHNGDGEIPIADGPRTGFETAITYKGFAAYVIVEAFNKDGHSLGRSLITKTLMPDNLLTVDIANEVLWLQKLTGTKENVPQEASVVEDTSSNSYIMEEDEEDDELTIYDTSVTDFLLGFVCASGLIVLIWFFRQGRNSWRWRSHYQALLGRRSDYDTEEKQTLRYNDGD